jgi:ParB-like chromosome segregation protein Spo0J
MKIEPVFLEQINVSNRLRQLDEAVVVSLVESMKHLGQLYPITIYSPNENEVHLVTGAHRVEAATGRASTPHQTKALSFRCSRCARRA